MDQNRQRATDNTQPEPNAPNVQDSQIMNVHEESNERYVRESDVRPTDVVFDRRHRYAPNAFRLFYDAHAHQYGNQIYIGTPYRVKRHIQQDLIQFVHANGGRFLRRPRGLPNDESIFEELSGHRLIRSVAIQLQICSRRLGNVGNPQES